MRITINHPEAGQQKTYSTAEIAAAATSATVENNDGFASGDLVLLGRLGEEKSEIVISSGVTGDTTVNFAACNFAHPARTPVSQITYNQAEIYRATSQSGSYSLITTISLDVDEGYTLYDDADGTTSSWYKIRYKNSSATTYSDYSDTVQGSGYTEDSLRAITDEILEDFGDPDAKELSRDQVRNYINASIRKITIEIVKMFPDYRTNYTTQALTSGTSTYSLPTNFLAFKRVDVGTSSTSAYKAVFESEFEGLPDTSYTETDPRVFIRGEYFGIRPNTCTGYAYIWYWDYPSSLDDESDTHGLPYGAREQIVTYSLYRAWMTKDQEKADRYKTLYKEGMKEYLEFIGQQRQMMSKTSISTIFGDELYVSN